LSWAFTSATILGALANGELTCDKLVPDEDLDQFAASIGQPGWFSELDRRAQLIVRRNGLAACVGSGHFVFTIRREVVRAIPPNPTLRALEVGVERDWLDLPPDRLGVWRLATARAYACHLGNVAEPWMDEELERIRDKASANDTAEPPLPALRRGLISRVPWRLRCALIDHLVRPAAGRLVARRSSSRFEGVRIESPDASDPRAQQKTT
jgi:hypothetical protein